MRAIESRRGNRRGGIASLLPVGLAISVVAALAMASQAQEAIVGDGIMEPVAFGPYDPNAPACGVPEGLTKVLSFAQDNDREFMQGVDLGLRTAAQDRGLEYRLAVANNDAAKIVEQEELFLAARVGGHISAPIDPPAQAHALQQLIKSGAYVAALAAPPGTTLLNAPQYLTGKLIGEAAAGYINEVLGGEANVVILTQDSVEFLRPRFVGIRDALDDIPGVKVVADIEPRVINKEGGFETMSTILQAHPDVDVVLGADTVVLGALAALEAADKARPEQFLGGIDGEPEALAAIQAADSPYKATVALSSPVFAYALGQYTADWLDGKSVPQAVDILPFLLTADNIPEYQADQENPRQAFADPDRRNRYIRTYGNICYDTRDQYVNFPWTSEAQ